MLSFIAAVVFVKPVIVTETGTIAGPVSVESCTDIEVDRSVLVRS